MKQHLILVALILTIAVIGCSGEDPAKPEADTAATETPATPEVPTTPETDEAVQVAEASETTEAEFPEPGIAGSVARDAPGVVVATLDDIQGFFADNEGNVIVMNFWATWCKPCIHEMPELAAFDRAYRDRGVAFLSLSTDAADDIETKLIPYVGEEDLPFTVYALANLDPDDLQEHLKVDMDFGLPTTFVLDKDREVVKVWMRNIEMADLVEVVEPLL